MTARRNSATLRGSMSYPPRLTNDGRQSSIGISTGRSTRTGIGFALFCLLFTLVALSSGGKISRAGGAKPKAVAAPSNVNGVQVTPPEVTLPARGGIQFTAEVTGLTDQSVTWSVNGSNGGNASVGTISGNGLYTAPDLPSDAPPAQFLVRATSLANSSMFGEATVTVTGRGSQFRSPSVSVQHGSSSDTVSSFNTDAVSVMYGASSSETFPTSLSNAISVQYGTPSNSLATYLSNAISVRYGTPSSNLFPTYLSNAVSVQYGTPSTNPFPAYFSNSVSVSYGNPPDICTLPPSEMVAWYPGEGNANDIQGNNNGTLQNGATFAAGKVGQAFSFDGVDDYVEVPNAANLNITGPLTIDVWVKLNAANKLQYIVITRLYPF